MIGVSAWFAQAKLYLFGALIVAVGIAFWWHGHTRYNAGIAAGNAEVVALKTQYAQAYADAQAQAKALQQEADAKALADAQAKAQAAQAQAQTAEAVAAAARQSTAEYQKALDNERKHSATVAAWLNASPPDGVRNPVSSG